MTSRAAGLLFLALTITAAPARSQTPAPSFDARVAEIVRNVDDVVAKGPFAPSWSSLEGFTVPAWYEDGKFGIFIHWGLYSVPAFGNEWYPRNMYDKAMPEFAHHLKTFGP